MEHHSSYSAPRSSRASGHTRSAASRQTTRPAPPSSEKQQFRTYFIMLRTSIFSSQPGDLLHCYRTPRIEMNISDTTDYKTVDVSFKIHSLLPLKKMTTTLESETIEFKRKKAFITQY